MKRISITLLSVLAAFTLLFAVACKKSDAPVVGTYKLVSVTMDNGREQKSYDTTSPVVTINSFILEIKDNYKWNMTITLPGVTETEHGTWKDNNGSYSLHEDKDDPVIYLTYISSGELTFNMSENGWAMTVTLIKV